MTLATPEPATSSPRTPTPLPLPLPLPIIDLVPLRAAAEPRPREEVEVLGLVARMIIDSLGRPWDPLKHPRDRKGRFIETFAEIRAFLKGKGSTKADFTGRVVAMDPDDTAIVQVRGGRGQYANLRDRLVRVPTEKLEGVEYKARIGQPAPRALPRSEMDKFLKRARGAGIRTDGMIGWKAEDPPDQLAELEKLAERAEKAGDITLRDALLAARARIRGESSNDDTINKAKALLPETREGSRDDKDIAPGDARGAEGEGRGDSSEVPAVEEDADADAGGGRGEQPRSRAGLRLPSGAGSDEDEWGDPGRLPSESVGDDAEFVDEYDLPEPADVDVQGAAAAAEHVGKKADQMARDALAVELRRDVHDLPEGYMQPNQKRDRAVEQLDRAIEDLQTSVEELERAQNNADRLRARARRMKKLGPPPRRPTQPVRPKRELFPDDNSYRDAMQDYQLQLNEYQADRQEYEEWQTTNARQGRVIADLARAENNLSRADNRVNRSIDRVQAKEDAVRRTLAQGRPQNFGQMLGALGRVLISKFKARRSSRPKGERKRAFGRGKRDARAPRRENSGVFNPRVTEQFVESLDDDDSAVLIDWENGEAEALNGADLAQLGELSGRPGKGSPAERLMGSLDDVRRRLNERGSYKDAEYMRDVFDSVANGDFDGALDTFERAFGNRPMALGRARAGAIRMHLKRFAADPERAMRSRADRAAPAPRGPLPDGWEDVDPAEWQSEQNLRAIDAMARHGGMADMLYAPGPVGREHREKFAEFLGISGERPSRVIRKGDQTIVLSEPASAEQVQKVADIFDKLQSRDPLSGEKVVRLVSYENMPEYRGKRKKARSILGDSYPGQNGMRLDINNILRSGRDPERRKRLAGPGKNFMPVFGDPDTDPLEYTMTHEWGHMRGSASTGAQAVQAAEIIEAEAKKRGVAPWDVINEQMASYEKEGLADGNGAEFFAENYAEWMMTDGKTDRSLTQEWAKYYGMEIPGLNTEQPKMRSEREDDLADAVSGADVPPNVDASGGLPVPSLPPPLNDEEIREQNFDEFKQWVEQNAPDAVILKHAVWLLQRVPEPFDPRNVINVGMRRARYEAYENALEQIDDPDVRTRGKMLLARLDPEYEAEMSRRDIVAEIYGQVGEELGDGWEDIRGIAGIFPDGLTGDLAAAEMRRVGVPERMIDAALGKNLERNPDAENHARAVLDMANLLRNKHGVDVDLPDDARRAEAFRGKIDRILIQDDVSGKDHDELLAAFKKAFPEAYGVYYLGGKPSEKARSLPSPKDDPRAQDPDGEIDLEEAEKNFPNVPASLPEAEAEDEAEAQGQGPGLIRRVLDEFLRGRSQKVKRGIGNLHLAARWAQDAHGEEIRKGDVVRMGPRDKRGAKGQHQRPAGSDGYIVNVVLDAPEGSDGVRRPIMEPQLDSDGKQMRDENGELLLQPKVKHLVVRHYDPKYIGSKHVRRKERGLKQPWPFPYWDFIIDPSDVERVNDRSDRAQDVFEHFGLHGRRMAGKNAGRLAGAIGKVFRLDRMVDIEPIQNRFLPDRDGKLIGEGDIVKHTDRDGVERRYEVIRPNNPWDNNHNPRVMLRPVQGGPYKQVQANRVRYDDDPKNLVFFRGAGGVVAPRPADIQNILRQRGISDPDIDAAVAANDIGALAKALRSNSDVLDFFAQEEINRMDLRDRMEIQNRGGRVPAGFIPVSDREFEMGQRDKYDAVMLNAARRGLFADDAGNPRRIDKGLEKDLFADYQGAEKDVAMREAYIAVGDALPEAEAAMGGDYYDLVQIPVKIAANVPLNNKVQRQDAENRLRNAAAHARAAGAKDAADKIDALVDNIRDWGADFDARRVAPEQGASLPERGLPSVAPSNAPEPGGMPPAAPGQRPFDRGADLLGAQGMPKAAEAVRRIERGEQNEMNEQDLHAARRGAKALRARGGLGVRDDAILKQIEDRAQEILDARGGGEAKPAAPAAPAGPAVDWTALSRAADLMENSGRYHAGRLLREIRDGKENKLSDEDLAFLVNGLDAVVKGDNVSLDDAEVLGRVKRHIEGMQRARAGNAPAAPAAPATPATPTPKPSAPALGGGFDQDDFDFLMENRARIRRRNRAAFEKIFAGEDVSDQEYSDVIDNLERLETRYLNKMRDAEAAYPARGLKMVKQRRREQAERDAQQVSARGKTEAIEDVYDAIGSEADNLRARGDRGKANAVDNAADDLADALEDAQAAHEADDKEARDRAVERAKDAADVINNNIGGDVGKRVQRDVQANRNRFDADDNRVEPMDRDEGNKKVADALAAEQDKLRKEGREGRKKARDLRDEIEGFEEAIDMAEQRRTDEKGREAYIKTAQGVIDGVAKNNPELAEVMQEVLDGQAARVRQAPEVVDTAGDAYRRKLQARLEELSGIDIQTLHGQLARSQRNGGDVPLLPAGWSLDQNFRSRGSLGEVYRISDPDGNFHYVKYDSEGGNQEVPYMAFLERLSMAGIKVPAFLGNREGKDKYFVLGHAGGDGVNIQGEFGDVWDAKGSESSWASRGFAIKRIGLADWNLRNPDDIVQMLLWNALAGNTDRHRGNGIYGTDADGYGIIVPFDHGRVFDGGYFGQGWVDPYDAVTGDGKGSNPNQFLRGFIERIRQDRTAGLQGYDESLDKIEAMLKGADDIYTPAIKQELMQRLQWLRDNKDDFINKIDRKVTT